MKIECKICGCTFNPVIERHYVSRDDGKTGVATIISSCESKLYDTFDCPDCGCQVVVQERKRNVCCNVASDVGNDDEEDEEEDEEEEIEELED